MGYGVWGHLQLQNVVVSDGVPASAGMTTLRGYQGCLLSICLLVFLTALPDCFEEYY